jgi:amino acid adenylation domain-containing protein
MQRGLVAESLLDEGRGLNVEQIVCSTNEPLDVDRLRRAWNSALDGFDALRLRFSFSGNGGVSQVVESGRSAIPFEVVHEFAEPHVAIERFLAKDRRRGFDLRGSPLSRVTVLRHLGSDWTMVWTVHHAAIDGNSYATVLERVFATYEGRLRGMEAARPAPEFREFLDWSARLDPSMGVEHLCRIIAGVQEPTPLPLFAGYTSIEPCDDEPADEPTITVDRDTTAALVRLAAETGVTLNTAVQLAWGLVLSRSTDLDDVVFGATWAGRATVPYFRQTVGLFINTLPVRIDLTSGPTVVDALRVLRAQHLAVRPYERTPLADVHKGSDLRGAPRVFDTAVVFEYERFFSELRRIHDGWNRRQLWSRSAPGFALCLSAHVVDDALALHLDYDSRRYTRARANQLLGYHHNLLRSMVERPRHSVHDQWMLDSETHTTLTEVETRRELVAPAEPVLEQIRRVAREKSRAIAVQDMDGAAISYRDLLRRADEVARTIRAHGARPGETVGILLPRSIDHVVAVLGVLASGGAFLSIDPTYPDDRLSFLAEDSGARCILTTGQAVAKVEALGCVPLLIDEDVPAGAQVHSAPELDQQDPATVAYLIYTSGSTGRPNGVRIPRRALDNHARAVTRAFELSSLDRVLQFAAPSFDVFIEEVIPTLATGATLVLRDDSTAQSARAFFEAIERHRVSVLNLPTAFWTELSRARDASRWPTCVRLVVVGGERVSPHMLERFRAGESAIRWLNAYGPTEATITSTCYDDAEKDHDSWHIPIGRPLEGTSHFILDRHQRPVPPGGVGQLFIGGMGLALDYQGNPELTADRFVRHPWRQGAHLYATGDLARRTARGNFVYIDRMDDLVKLRGFRIELGEIDARLCEHRGVVEAAAIVVKRSSPEAQLVAWVGDRGTGVTARSLREHLEAVLPSHMVPATYFVSEKLPTTSAGKIDRTLLAARSVAQMAAAKRRAVFEPPRGAPAAQSPSPQLTNARRLEYELTSIWRDLLDLAADTPIAPTSSFFELGGHSLLAIELLSRLEARYGTVCHPQGFFQQPTIRRLAHALSRVDARDQTAAIVRLSEGRSGVRPLFLMPGITGSALEYLRLVEALETSIPVYAVQTHGGTETPIGSLASDARRYADLVRSVQQAGPYAIAGYSAAGITALAVAEALVEDGEEPDFVGLIDSTPPVSIRIPSPFTSLLRLGRFSRTTVGRVGEALEGPRPVRRLWSRTVSAVSRSLVRWGPGRSVPTYRVSDVLRMGDVDQCAPEIAGWQARLDAIVRYEPRGLPVHVTLFRTPLDPFEGPHEPDLGWRRAAAAGVSIIVVQGRHVDLLGKRVGELGRVMSERLLRVPTGLTVLLPHLALLASELPL